MSQQLPEMDLRVRTKANTRLRRSPRFRLHWRIAHSLIGLDLWTHTRDWYSGDNYTALSCLAAIKYGAQPTNIRIRPPSFPACWDCHDKLLPAPYNALLCGHSGINTQAKRKCRSPNQAIGHSDFSSQHKFRHSGLDPGLTTDVAANHSQGGHAGDQHPRS